MWAWDDSPRNVWIAISVTIALGSVVGSTIGWDDACDAGEADRHHFAAAAGREMKQFFWVGTMLAPAALVGLGAFAFAMWVPMPRLDAERAECDKQVAALFNSRDVFDLQRAMFLINKLDCSVGMRLPHD